MFILNNFCMKLLSLSQIAFLLYHSLKMSHSSPPTNGISIIKNPFTNKGTSFTSSERENLKISGLFPAGDPLSLELKVSIAMAQFFKKTSPIEKYIFLHTIQDSDETLYYSILMNHTQEVMPFVYTPTVGQACQEWSTIFRHVPRGLYISLKDKGNIKQLLENYPNHDIKAIVFTDGERILGLGDLGANGMGIPIGKLALYTTCAGINPSQCLPVHIDVGTNTQSILDDPAYMGLRQQRERGPVYDELIEEFFSACQAKYGRNVLMQFEDFGNLNAFRLLDNYRNRANCFNDDIQGTASVVLGGIISSLRLADKKKLKDHRYLFFGAGEAGIGIANLLASAIQIESGCTLEEAYQCSYFVDSKGLITNIRLNDKKFEHHKIPYAHDTTKLLGKDSSKIGNSLIDAVNFVEPTALIGVSAQGGSFTKEICEKMTKISKHPLIMALSNPTSKAECTAKDAYTWTEGKCIFCSGSPFDPVTLSNGQTFIPGQGNNAYIFPGVGLGSIASGADSITDQDFLLAAKTLAKSVSEEQLSKGCAYPSLNDIRDVSIKIAAAVATNIVKTGRSSPEIKNLIENYSESEMINYCISLMYVPKYN
eukprot:gene12924-17322_t